jgi:hypothetical protein
LIKKIMKAQIVSILMLLTILSLTLPAYAQPPEIPQEFRGNVIVNGTPPPQGTTILVRSGSIQIAATTTDAQGRYGYSSPLLVSTTNGSLLEFSVNGIKAKETATSKSGEMTTLNLTVSSSAPPSQQPAIPPESTLPSTPPSTGFAISNLNINQSSVKPGEPVTVTAEVKNSSGSESSYKIVLQVNNATEIEQTVTLGHNRSQKLTYTISKEKVGKYTVAIGSQSNSFSVNPPDVSWISTITNQPWWLYAVIGIGVILVILIGILIISRRNASYF